MPLLDHYKPPLDGLSRIWHFQTTWATLLADQLTERLPPEFAAWETCQRNGNPLINVASYPPTGDAEEDRWRSEWQPRPPDRTGGFAFPERYEVQVVHHGNGRELAAVVALAVPGNKETVAQRRAFAGRAADLLRQGVAVVAVDVVTTPQGNLHAETLRCLGCDPERWVEGVESGLGVVAYRPVTRSGRGELDVWVAPVAVGQPLPRDVPLRLIGDYFIPVDFEAAYSEVCRRRRLIR